MGKPKKWIRRGQAVYCRYAWPCEQGFKEISKTDKTHYVVCNGYRKGQRCTMQTTRAVMVNIPKITEKGGYYGR